MKNSDPDIMLVADKVCDRCLLGSKALVSDEARAEILDECAKTGRAFICHKGSFAGKSIVCRSFYERDMSLVVRLAKMLNRVKFVKLPEMKS
jgi:hypothetical protein